ncbi:MAG: DUF3531 family protein [Cyanobacteria bacterium P01_E01_bin.6]
MKIEFRECDCFNLWIWLEFSTAPSQMEQQYVEEVFDSWFYLGKLGGFNAENLQVQEAGLEVSYMDYSDDTAEDALMSLMHNMSDLEYEGTWARGWFDLGTSDAIALDILINALKQLSKEFVSIEKLVIGGENPDWPIPEAHRSSFMMDEASDLN